MGRRPDRGQRPDHLFTAPPATTPAPQPWQLWVREPGDPYFQLHNSYATRRAAEQEKAGMESKGYECKTEYKGRDVRPNYSPDTEA